MNARHNSRLRAERAVVERPELSDYAIAKSVGVSSNTVLRARQRMEVAGRIPTRVRPRDRAATRVAMSSRWVPVKRWESLYEVNDHGQVRSLRSGIILGGLRTKQGYIQYELRDAPRLERLYAHRLVAEAFLGTPTGPLVRHLDDVKHNNHVSNLAYGDHIENASDAIRNGLMRGRAPAAA